MGPEMTDFSVPVQILEGSPKGILSVLYNSFLMHRREEGMKLSKTKWELLVGEIYGGQMEVEGCFRGPYGIVPKFRAFRSE